MTGGFAEYLMANAGISRNELAEFGIMDAGMM